ncbi:RsmB/NOP family class I SAM-dependent RNA methyltransferase [Candidatus Pacearchaeota archaeon]|nr:RsmB/NOP family class I SAM-dependent RNA methyltransferase [Candidatus Pacearchaeota archaeon]
MMQPKQLFEERMKKLVEDYDKWLEFSGKSPINSIRCNTLKIKPEKLKENLENKGWKIQQPFPEFPEIMIITSELKPGELGKATEHLLGYYYVQEISSMMPVLALNPKPNELVLDLCASPGSKTTQMSAVMENKGTIIANDKDIGRILILSSNLERCGCTNVIVSRNDAVQFCNKLQGKIKFDKILLDVPCSGEGTIRSSPKTFLMWNIKMISKLSRMQRKIASSAVSLLKDNGEIVYSTCTHSPEENESNVNFLAERFNLQVEKIKLPVKCRPGITNWENEKFSEEIKNCCRIYPQDNDTEGFFLAKLKKK